jgi:hypothetical protein
VQAIDGKWMKMGEKEVVIQKSGWLGSGAAVSLHAAVDLFAVSHLDHEDEKSFVPNPINGAAVFPRSHIDAVELLLRLQLFHTMRAWILLELFYVRKDLPADTRVKLLKFPKSGVSELQGV